MQFFHIFLLVLSVAVQGISGMNNLQLKEPPKTRNSDFDLFVTLTKFDGTLTSRCKGLNFNCSDFTIPACGEIRGAIPNGLLAQDTDRCQAFGDINVKTKGKFSIFFQLNYFYELHINLQCRTFGELLSKALMMSLQTKWTHLFSFTIDSYLPKPTKPYDPAQVQDEYLYLVAGELCDINHKPISTKEWKTEQEAKLFNELKKMMPISQIGQLLYSNDNIRISNLSTTLNETYVLFSFLIIIPGSYATMLNIDPSCDTASLLQLSLNSTTGSTYSICGVGVKDITPPTTTTTTISSAATESTLPSNATGTTGSASTTKSTLNKLVLASIASYILVNI